MMEMVVFFLRSLYKTYQPTKTETFTTTTISSKKFADWREQSFQSQLSNTDKFLSRPQAERVVTTFKPVPVSTVVTGPPATKPIGITGGAPVTTTKTTVTYATGKPRTVMVLK